MRNPCRCTAIVSEPIREGADALRLLDVEIMLAGKYRPLVEAFAPLQRDEDVELRGLEHAVRA